MKFKLKSPFKPAADQPHAIAELTQSLNQGKKHQVLLGVTGSGKTFTMANVIENVQKPTLVISHNKTLAAQLYQEFRDFFPENAVSYFVSYYDYYQPEAYIPQTDTYIEKEVDINEEIDRLRLKATTHLFTRADVIVVASVSCIYNIGSPLEWGKFVRPIVVGEKTDRQKLMRDFVSLQYDRSDYELARGTFRLKGDLLQLWPAYEELAVNIQFLDDEIETITPIHPISGKPSHKPLLNLTSDTLFVYPAKHYMTNRAVFPQAMSNIKAELHTRLKQLKNAGRELEAHRLEQKVTYDLEMIEEVGYVNGIENYSRHFDGRASGDPPYTLFDYFEHAASLRKGSEQAKNGGRSGIPPERRSHFEHSHQDFLVIIDESHMTIPQINGMYRGDQVRKQTLIDFGFRLPSALDNRPLKFSEFLRRVPQAIYTSATPSSWEISMARSMEQVARGKKFKWPKKSTTSHTPHATSPIVEQLIRPTGLVDPEIVVKPSTNQIDDLLGEITLRVAKKQRVLVTTLTKRTAEALSDFLKEKHIKVHHLHSDIVTLDRSDILDSLRLGKYDVVVGINLLREGLDLPEVSLVAILDADKEGFLRSHTSLIQTMGRAARHVEGKVIMYADKITDSMKAAIHEVERRRQIQLAYNQKHHITPQSIKKPVRIKLLVRPSNVAPKASVIQLSKREAVDLKNLKPDSLTPEDKKRLVRGLRRKMLAFAAELNFELAATLRDTIEKLQA